jgi:ribonucleases P/MRP protein subunit RPP40
MIRGKKAFDRIVRAFSKVLIDKESWLLLDLQTASNLGVDQQMDQSQTESHMERRLISPEFTPLSSVSIPADILGDSKSLEDADFQSQLLEFLGLAMIHSPRVKAKDDIDPALCVYRLPSFGGDSTVQDLVHVRYRGLLPASFIRRISSMARQEAQAKDLWWASRVTTFDGNAWTQLQTDDRCLEWDMN